MNENLYKAIGLLAQAPGAASLRLRLDHIFLVLEAGEMDMDERLCPRSYVRTTP
jgi:hypothetical protein